MIKRTAGSVCTLLSPRLDSDVAGSLHTAPGVLSEVYSTVLLVK